MGCLPSAVADKGKVTPAPSPHTLRGDLISRDEARHRRNQSVAKHHAKANKMAQTIAYNTLAEKEMLSTASTEFSYRSGRAFLMSAAANTVAETSGSEQGSSSTVSDGANPLRSEQQAAPTRSKKNDGGNATSTRLPYAVPEEDSPQQHDPSDVMGQNGDATGQEVKLQNGGVKVHRIEPVECLDDRSEECEKNAGSNSQSRTDVNVDEHEVKGHETASDTQTSQTDENGALGEEMPSRTVQCAAEGTEDSIKFARGNVDEDEITKPTDNGSVVSSGCLPAG